jgi:hypothetical protein
MKQSEKKELTERFNLLSQRIKDLEAMNDQQLAFSDGFNPHALLLTIIDETTEEANKIEAILTTTREYIYNFKSGGWNTEFASTIEEAREKAIRRWKDLERLDVDPDSFRLTNANHLTSLMQMFH